MVLCKGRVTSLCSREGKTQAVLFDADYSESTMVIFRGLGFRAFDAKDSFSWWSNPLERLYM